MSRSPTRIKFRRGEPLPEGAVYVGRPTIFGNPFVGPYAVAAYRDWLDRRSVETFEIVELFCAAHGMRALDLRYPDRPGQIGFLVLERIARLRGKDLACWCGPRDECHADVLLELANR